MIQLYDHFHKQSQDLHFSLKKVGFEGPTVVINDDGFLPKGVTSAYSYFCQMERGTGKPLYFNQVPVPTFWEITGTNTEGEIWDYNQRRGKIFYAEPKHLRLVKNVDWMDRGEKVRFTDHYNQYGWLYARTYFTAGQTIATRTYFTQTGQEVIVENFLTGDIILNWEGQTHFFENRVEFFRFYFKHMSWDVSQIWYNSLSTPFFLSYNMAEPGQDVLFWQEAIGNELPGNMRVLLNNDATRTQRVIVQDQEVYAKLLGMVEEKHRSKLAYLGYVYPEQRQNHNQKDILIVTNSDQIEKLDELTEQLSDYQFHIAALTEMSQRLLDFHHKGNVQLYPNVSSKQLDNLYETCDLYFDINHSIEVLDAVRRAFENNMLIYAFVQTQHNPKLVMRRNVFAAEQSAGLVEAVRGLTGNFAAEVHRQRQETSHEAIGRYQELLG